MRIPVSRKTTPFCCWKLPTWSIISPPNIPRHALWLVQLWNKHNNNSGPTQNQPYYYLKVFVFSPIACCKKNEAPPTIIRQIDLRRWGFWGIQRHEKKRKKMWANITRRSAFCPRSDKHYYNGVTQFDSPYSLNDAPPYSGNIMVHTAKFVSRIIARAVNAAPIVCVGVLFPQCTLHRTGTCSSSTLRRNSRKLLAVYVLVGGRTEDKQQYW